MLRSLRFILPLLALFAFALLGCGKPQDKFVGSYTGKQVLTQKAMDVINKSPMAARIKDQMSKMQMSMTLSKDMTAAVTATNQPQAITGTWKVEDNEVVVDLKSGQPLKLKPSSDGKTLTADMSEAASQYGTLTFTKN